VVRSPEAIWSDASATTRTRAAIASSRSRLREPREQCHGVASRKYRGCRVEVLFRREDDPERHSVFEYVGSAATRCWVVDPEET